MFAQCVGEGRRPDGSMGNGAASGFSRACAGGGLSEEELARIDGLKTSIHDKEARIAELQAKANENEEELGKLAEENEWLKEKTSILQETVTTKQQEVAHALKTAEAAKKEREDLAASHAEAVVALKKQVDKYQEELESLKKTFEEDVKMAVEADKKLAEEREAQQQLEAEAAGAPGSPASGAGASSPSSGGGGDAKMTAYLKGQVSIKDKRIHELETALSSVNNDLLMKKAQLQDTIERTKVHKQKAEEMEATIIDLNAQLSEARRNNASAGENTQALLEEMEELKKELLMSKKRDALRRTSIFGSQASMASAASASSEKKK